MVTQPSTNIVAERMPLARMLTRSHLGIALAYVAGYGLLDWVSYVHPFSVYGITPWNPQVGLSFALIIVFGRAYLPWLFVAPFAADLFVRQLPLPIGVEIAVVAVIGLGYGAATSALLSPGVALDPTLASRRAMLSLISVAAASVAVVALAHAGILVASGLMPSTDFLPATFLAFVGDMIGVMVVTPFVLILFTRRRWPAMSWELAALLFLVAAALWIVFGFADALRYQLFYIFFIPVIWTAVRFGLEGVTVTLMATQIGLIAAIQLSGQSPVDVLTYQALMVVLAGTGLALGVLVNEQRRAQQQLRLQQDALARAARLGAMGEFAAAVAHEINQPLTAIANYAQLARRAAEKRPPDASAAADAASSVVQQVNRAAEVVRRLRNLIRLGRSETEPVSVAQLFREAHSICRPELERRDIEFQERVARNLPAVLVDALQIEQVIVNLVRNSVEALAQAGRYDGRIVLDANLADADTVKIMIHDNGPGFDPELIEGALTPFTSTKLEGLGIGLALARSIVESHGGKLNIESSPRGATVSFTLKCATGEIHQA